MPITTYRDRSRLSPWRELDQMAHQLNRVFGAPLEGEAEVPGWMPPVNVEETQEALVLTAELPGLRPEEVDVELENNVLTIRGRKEEVREEATDRRFHLWERRYGSFQRSFTLPRTVAPDQIAATFDHGVLEVRMPKAAEAKGRKIEIKREA